MKKILFGCSVTAVVLGLSFGVSMAGNGAPSGAHYNLNIIGVEKGKNSDMTDSNRHTIFVALGKNATVQTKIYLTEGDFQVCDGNGFDSAYDCSGNMIGRSYGAVFQLPNNGCWVNNDPDGYNCETLTAQKYEVYVRALGTPGGNGTITTCVETYDDLGAPVDECSTENVILQRNAGPSKFVDKSQELTTIVLSDDIYDAAGNLVGKEGVRYGLFEDDFGQYFWDYDNNGLRLIQLRFYDL